MTGLLFRASPSVVPANMESTVVLTSCDSCFRFFDDVTYDVTVIPRDEQDVPVGEKRLLLGYDDNRAVQHIRPVNGELHVTYYFADEQEWIIHVATSEYEPHQNPMFAAYGARYWAPIINRPKVGINVSVYSLREDLYGTVALKGDLHLHTDASDGTETPATTVAGYREAGFDFMAVTDHHIYDAAAAVREKLDFMPGLDIVVGEEIHNGYVGMIHMVNLGSRYSVNDRYLHHADEIAAAVEALRGTVDVPCGVDETDYLHRVVLYDEIKKSGGFAVFPHPYWVVKDRYHVGERMTTAVLQNGLCDAFEIVGGCTPEGNNLQTALYYQLRAEGLRLPVVGSSDSHTVLGGGNFNRLYTVVLAAPDRDVIAAVAAGNSVAVEALEGENVRVYGAFRLVRYAHFLRRCYFPLHNELCAVEGNLLKEFFAGDEQVRVTLEHYEAKLAALQKEFFGL